MQYHFRRFAGSKASPCFFSGFEGEADSPDDEVPGSFKMRKISATSRSMLLILFRRSVSLLNVSSSGLRFSVSIFLRIRLWNSERRDCADSLWIAGKSASYLGVGKV
jgi:hypothetical protein